MTSTVQNINKLYLIILLILSCSTNLFSQRQSDPLTVTIPVNEGDTLTVLQILNIIKNEGVKLGYTNKLNLKHKIVLKKKLYTTEELLTLVTQNTTLSILANKGKILLVRKRKNRQDYIVVSGFVREAISKEVLIGSTIYESNLNKGTVTNNYGFYSLKLKKGNHTLVASYLGFQNQTINISNEKDTMYYDFNLVLNPNSLEEVIIKPQIPEHDYHHKGYEQLSKNLIDNATNLFGENDFIKALHNKVGVVGNSQGTGALNVRGGNSGHNLVLIDGISVYNYNHLGGMLSIFNSPIIKKVGFYRGAFPAKYNGRLSSVIDVRTKDGNMEEFHGDFSWSPMALSTSLEGPIIKEKMSFVGSFRRSFLDFFIKDVHLNLYDFNFKVNYIANRSNRFFLSLYSGRDRFKMDKNTFFNNFNLNWGNLLATLKWNRVHSPRLFQQTSLTYSTFKNTIGGNLILNNLEQRYTENQINDVSLNTACDFFISEKIQTKFGLELKHVVFKNPLKHPTSGDTKNLSRIASSETSVHTIGYVDNQLNLNEKIHLNFGFNTSIYFVQDKSFYTFLPRMVLTYSPFRKGEIFVSYSKLSQFQHDITLASVSLPNELRTPSSTKIPPETSEIFEIGCQYRFNNNDLINVQTYYKELDDIIRYRWGQNVLNGMLAPEFNNRLLRGQRTSMGVEVQMIKKINKLNIEASYALSKTEDRFDKLNYGKPFPAKLDIRNILKVSLNMALNKKLKIFTNWSYSSGQSLSVPVQTYTKIDDVLNVSTPSTSIPYSFQINTLNQYKLPDNYRLDIGCHYTKKTKTSNVWKYSFGINNLVGRSAPFMVESRINEDSNQLEIQELRLYKFIPYVGIRFKF